MSKFIAFPGWKKDNNQFNIYVDPLEVIAVQKGNSNYLETNIFLKGGATVAVPGDPDEVMAVLSGVTDELRSGAKVQHVTINGDVTTLNINQEET